MSNVSGDRMVDYLLYGVPSEKTRNYFQNELNNISASLTPNHWAVDMFQNTFNQFYSNEAINNAQMILSQSASQFRDDIIHLITYDQYTPNLLTQRYIMACPEVWDMRMKGLSNDFNLQYMDTQPYEKDITWRTDYINVMDGMLITDTQDSGHYCIYEREDSNPLSERERNIILLNWDVVRDILSNDEDPTII